MRYINCYYMIPLNIQIPRHSIAHNFSQWAALSALRSGSPLKSRNDIYPLLKLVNFEVLLATDQPIQSTEFEKWHKKALTDIASCKPLPIGWAAKIVNVYLKSMCYLSGIGRPGLISHLHPPIDSILWKELKSTYENYSDIWNRVYSKNKIKDIKTYEEYAYIIDGMREIAKKEECLLIEVDRFWNADLYQKQ